MAAIYIAQTRRERRNSLGRTNADMTEFAGCLKSASSTFAAHWGTLWTITDSYLARSEICHPSDLAPPLADG